MKIAVIAYNHPESSLPLAKYLADKGHLVDYYYITNSKTRSISAFDFSKAEVKIGITELKEKDIPAIFNVWKDNKSTIHLLRFFWLSIKFFPFVKRLFQRLSINPALKILNDRNYDAINLIGQDALLKYIHQKLICKNKIHSLHEVAPHYSGQKIPNSLIRFLLSNKISVIVHSNASYKAINEYQISKETSNIHEIPFGLFETYLSIRPSCNIPYTDYLLFYGRIVSYKGLDLLYNALEILKLKLPNLKTIIAGEGTDDAILKLRSNPNCIVINQYISNEDLVELNMKAKAIVCPYESASQSGIVMTSFVFDKPIIATSVGAFTEVITNNENGLLLKYNTPEDLAIAIFQIFSNMNFYSTLQQGVKNFSIKHPQYDWNNIAEQTIDVFKSENK